MPFTSVASQTYDVVENEADTNIRETRLRGQLAATSKALGEVSAEIVRFLATAD